MLIANLFTGGCGMKNQRHKRKEIYSVLMVSNTNGKSRQFQVAALTLRLFAGFIVLLCLIIGWLIYQASKADGTISVLRRELAEQTGQVQALQAEKDALTKDKLQLTAENEALKQEAAEPAPEEQEPEEEEEDQEEASAVPSRYPSDGASILKPDAFSEEHPYISISTYTDGHIIAAGDGTVTAVSSDDTYAHIIEIEHEGGYKTRYLCHKSGEVKVEEGLQVLGGDTLVTVTSDDCQMDYQVLLNGEPIDPLSVIDARG